MFLDTKISKKVSQSAALNVIQTHRSNINLTNSINASNIAKQVPKNTTTMTATATLSSSLPSSKESNEKENASHKENNQSSVVYHRTHSIDNEIAHPNNEISFENK